MNAKDLRIGERVNHPKRFGHGTVLSLDVTRNIAEVLFDQAFGGSRKKKLNADYLEKYDAYTANKKTEAESKPFVVGDYVSHITYGDAVIVKKKDSFKFLIRLKIDNSYREVYKSDLKHREADIIKDDELGEEVIDSSFKIVPSNYNEQSCYSTNAKRLLTHLRKKYQDEGIATIKSYNEENGTAGVIIEPNKGIVVFKMIEQEFPLEAITSSFFEVLANKWYSTAKNYYIDKFMHSKSLCTFIDNQYKLLRFPLRFVLVFQSIDLNKISAEDKRKIAISNRDMYFHNFSTIFSNNDLFSHFEPYDSSFSKIEASFYGSIIERVVPENATLISIAPTEKMDIDPCQNPEFTPITGEEREFSALYLDDIQIKAINDTKPGHYLTLANPGTGKSVLLVSKAYRIQSKEKNNNVLITCFNKNLADHHDIFANVSGLKTSNLHIMTFHKLVKDILDKLDSGFLKYHPLSEDGGVNFELAVNRLEELIGLGKVETSLNAIFIDEIQLFEPKWIDICYQLLDRTNDKDFFFEMFGDINQDVKSQHSKGKASWQNTKLIPPLTGRVRKLDRNYRNTKLIADYINCMISEFNEYLIKHDVEVDKESACLTSETMRKGSLRTKILRTSSQDFSKVRKTIEELYEKGHADYTDIAIIYPATKYGKYYTPIWKIQKELEENGIPFSIIHGDNIQVRQQLYECDGVIMSTIDSCLGLDFKYVILCGIHFWDLIYDEKTHETKQLDSSMLFFDPELKFKFAEIGKKIYSACSRARDGLFIVDDLNGNSPIKQIIRPISGRGLYDET